MDSSKITGCRWEDIKPLEYIDDKTNDQKDQPYRFDLDEKGFPVFSDKNIALVTAFVENDSQYNQTDEEAIKRAFNGMYSDNEDDRLKNICRAVYEVDTTNSTHLTTIGKLKIKELMEELGENPKKIEGLNKEISGGVLFTARVIHEEMPDLRDRLKNGCPSLIDDIAKAAEKHVNEHPKNQLGEIQANKNNFSFATKFCHWACVYADDMEDNYCIYDNVVVEVLPYYVSCYMDKESKDEFCRLKSGGSELIFKKDYKNEKYKEFAGLYKALKDSINDWRGKHGFNSDLGYSEIDRLLWYYFKGKQNQRKTLRETAAEIWKQNRD